jgi:hypothetical protein
MTPRGVETLFARSPLPGKPSVSERRSAAAVLTQGEETLVVDARAHLTPAQMVERKLLGLMKAAPVPVSCMHSVPRLAAR